MKILPIGGTLFLGSHSARERKQSLLQAWGTQR